MECGEEGIEGELVGGIWVEVECGEEEELVGRIWVEVAFWEAGGSDSNKLPCLFPHREYHHSACAH